MEDYLDKLQKLVSEINVNSQNKFKLAYSVGTAEYNPSSDQIDEIITESDAKMYEMKEKSRSKNI